MRMHSYGKCSPNLTVGAITIFSLIVLYSYWNLSTHNRDLLAKLHTSEEQAIQLAKTNDAIQGTYDKTLSEKSKLEFLIMEQQVAAKDIRKRLSDKDQLLLNLNEELDNERKSSHSLRQQVKRGEGQVEGKEKETTELKSKVVSLERQLLDQKIRREKAEISLQEALSGLEKQKSSPSSAVVKEATKVDDFLAPAFMSDPAEQQMNPEAAAPAPPIPSKEKELEHENGGGELANEGIGVLPIPGGNMETGGGNLDAAEDDRDHPMKDEQAHEDDQFPDGVLSQKEVKESHAQGVGPPPPVANLPQSGQDHREAAHLQEHTL